MKQRGMTLVELMVAMAIGLGVTLAVATLLVASENHKRTTTSTNDAEQAGTYAFYALDKVLRQAGSALAESAYPTDHGVLGCKLNAGTGVPYPRASAFPYPFATFLTGVTNTLTVAPVLIGQGMSQGGSDVIAVMGGSGAAGGVSRVISGGGSATTMILDNTVGFQAGDLGFVSQNGVTDCLLEQVTSYTTSTLTVGTGIYTPTATTTNLATLAANTLSYVTPIGNATSNNMQFMLFGVDSNRTLYSYDLLQLTAGNTAQPMVDGVVQMNAIYGIDTNNDGIQDAWAGPGDAGWTINNVMASATLMKQIVSIRVALVVRGEYFDKNAVSPATLTLFQGLTNAAAVSLQQTVNISGTDLNYRYRVFEFTVPLRNMLLLAGVS